MRQWKALIRDAEVRGSEEIGGDFAGVTAERKRRLGKEIKEV